METKLNLIKLAQHFSDENAARKLLEGMRWPDGPACPHCGGDEPYTLKPKPGSKTRRGVYKCRACRKQFTVTVRTIFEDSHIPLSKWLLAIHLLCASKKGMSSHQLHRMLGITYKSAWFMTHRLRYAMSKPPLADKLRGVVEIDETYVGGRTRGGKRGRGTDKTPVVALIERGGNVRAFPMERLTADRIQGEIRKAVNPYSIVVTDEFNVYRGLNRHFLRHDTVHHASKEYVRGLAHTNTAENFFSILKRGIHGVYQHVGKGHLGAYVNEFAFRYDARKVSDGARALLAVKGAEGKRLTYKQPAGAC